MPEQAPLPADALGGLRERVGLIVCLAAVVLAAVVLAACAAPNGAGTAVPEATVPGPEALPATDEFVPARVDGVIPWTPISSLPNEFDISARYASAAVLADTFRSELEAGWAGGPKRPTFELDTFSEGDTSAVIVISEIGPGDDSVAGTQYALVIGRAADGWRLEGLWARTLCRRGVDQAGQLCL